MYKTNRFKLLTFFLLTIILGSFFKGHCQEVTTKSLLKEMIDRETLTRYPVPEYKCAQFSSYDRNTISPDQPGWFANADRSQWLRIEKNRGRREFVMMDKDGPGAIVRFWITVADYGGNGILRIYLDKSKEPVIEGDPFKIISKNEQVGYPLSSSVSKLTDFWKRGHNLYFPITYAGHCKITYQSAAMSEQPGAVSGEALYYNINYRTYTPGTNVKTFSMNDIKENKSIILKANKTLTDIEKEAVIKIKSKKLAGELNPGKELVKKISGSKAIHSIKIKLSADNYEQALRSTVLEISFDNEKTVWCPVGDFFGTGYKFSPFSTFYNSAKSDGILETRWVMPFNKSCKVKLVNYGEQKVRIDECKIEIKSYNWDERSMHFGAGWFEKYKLYTRQTDKSGDGMFDLNYVTLKGKGLLAGTGVTVFNTVAAWWGEGDEKVYVDNESFPSQIGTGTEDYYGYAWSMPNKFSHPFIAQPDGNGNINPGYTVNTRYRGLDAIPFTKKLKFDMEIWHWATCKFNYAPVVYWYMIPGGISNRGAIPEQVKNVVTLNKSDLFSSAPNKNGKIEAEYLKVNTKNGNIREQSGSQYNWSNNCQIWWTDAVPGDKANLKFKIEKESKYQIKINLTKAIDYGIYSLSIDGKTVLKNYDAYHKDGIVNSVVNIGNYNLKKGEHSLTVNITGANPNAVKKYMFGIDYIDFIEK